ncbi:MAG: ATP/GTP hydrolase [Candidatus Peregrinibacteria bacterium GW2011_GWA2_38_36]|nr:MAG: ATP/GTP hydrolase [Candidatus Peregrinibacteria bacterium GW2011_GWA2_38_36]
MLSSLYTSKNEINTTKFAQNMVKSMNFKGVICLYGEIGAGKTVFAKGCAEALGVNKSKIKSPTFSFIREYKEKGLEMYHCDFYRINNDDEILHHTLDEIMKKKNALVIIEWAQNLSQVLPKNRIDIFFEYKAKNSRKLTIKFPQNTDWILDLYKKYFTPAHVIKHMRTVADFAVKMGEKYIKKGIYVDLKKVEEIALLHDLLKPISFFNWNNSQFGQKMAPSKNAIKLWTRLRKKYGYGNDVQATVDVLKNFDRRNSNMASLANSVLTQQFDAIISQKYPLKTLEETFVYYADKRVKHTKVVSLKERFEDGRKRYFQNKKIPKYTSIIERKIYKMEKSLLHNLT